MRRDHRTAGSRTAAASTAAGQRRRPAALADREQRADQRADHRVAEGVRDHGARPRRRRLGPAASRGGAAPAPWSRPPGAGRTQRSRARPGSARARPRSSRRGRAGAGCHRVSCLRSGSAAGGVVADPVGVAPPQRGEPGVEPGRRAGPIGADPDIGRQRPASRRRAASAGAARPAGHREVRRERPGRARAPRHRSARRRSAGAARAAAARAPGPPRAPPARCAGPAARPSRRSCRRRRQDQF